MREWLKNIRKSHQLTQDKVAKQANISRSYYTHIENGTKTPTVEVAKRLGKCLGFKWTYFFEDNCSQKEHSA